MMHKCCTLPVLFTGTAGILARLDATYNRYLNLTPCFDSRRPTDVLPRLEHGVTLSNVCRMLKRWKLCLSFFHFFLITSISFVLLLQLSPFRISGLRSHSGCSSPLPATVFSKRTRVANFDGAPRGVCCVLCVAFRSTKVRGL